jgi:hypothetical protein
VARHLFIAQQTLVTWMDQEKIDFNENVMTIKADGRAFKLIEAVRFVKIEDDQEDKPGLLGRVKTNLQLEEMGAERYRDSVLLEDVAYKVQEGFIGEVFIKEAVDVSAGADKVADSGKPPPPPPPPPARAPHQDEIKVKSIEAKERRASPLQASLEGAADPAQKKDTGDQEASDEELLTRFLLDNL